MTNFSIAAIMNNERGSGLVRPTPMTDNTKLGNYSKSVFAPQMSPKSNKEEEVDVEQWSDSEDHKQSRSPASLSSLETNSKKNATQSPE